MDNKDSHINPAATTTITLSHSLFLASCLAKVIKDANRHVYGVYSSSFMGWSVNCWTPHNAWSLDSHRKGLLPARCRKWKGLWQRCIKESIFITRLRRIITFYCDLWRLGSRAGSIHSVLTNNSPSQTSSLGLNIAGKRKNCWTIPIASDWGINVYLELLFYWHLVKCVTLPNVLPGE